MFLSTCVCSMIYGWKIQWRKIATSFPLSEKKLRKVASSDTIYVIIYRIELINREQIQTYRSGDKYERKSEKIDDSFFFLFL